MVFMVLGSSKCKDLSATKILALGTCRKILARHKYDRLPVN